MMLHRSFAAFVFALLATALAAQARLTYDELERLLSFHLRWLHAKGLQPADVIDRRQDIVLPIIVEETTEIAFVMSEADGAGPERLEKINRLFDLIGRKRALVERIQRDIQLQSRLAFWLYVHVPLSVALLAALFCHVVSVFFYW